MTLLTNLNLFPSKQEIDSFGDLAYVTFPEHLRVMALPKVQQKRYIAYLKKRIGRIRKTGRVE